MDSFERDGLTFDVTDSGPRDGEVVILLHGFPQDRSAWNDVAPLLNEAGYRTVAPDQRGYSAGASPSSRKAYRMRELTDDVLALANAADARRVHLVGHDWGGAVAWALAASSPERLASLTVLSTPHPAALSWAVTHSDQWKRSQYIGLFQLPRIPERRLRAMMPRFYVRTGLSQEQAQRYTDRFDDPSSLTPPMNWYRAMLTVDAPASIGSALRRRVRRTSAKPTTPKDRRIAVPTTYIWGRRDFALGEAAARRTAQHVGADYRFVELEHGHWLPEVDPSGVAGHIVERAAAHPA